jgi:CheY-like chemotaxis protein
MEKQKILTVDDDVDFRASLQVILERAGYDVLAETGKVLQSPKAGALLRGQGSRVACLPVASAPAACGSRR